MLVNTRARKIGKPEAGQKRATLSIGAPVFGLDLADGKAPTEFRLFKMGDNPSTKGTWLFDADSAASVLGVWAARGLKLMADYEHQSLASPPIISPAAAKSWVPEVRADGLWATQVEWTDRARAMIEAGEYAYFSPAFDYDPETMRVTRIINFALTNNPALDGIEPLAASDAITTEAKPMKVKCSKCTAQLAVGDDEEKKDEMYCAACSTAAATAQASAALTAQIAQTVGLRADVATVVLVGEVEKLTKFARQALTALGKTDTLEALGILEAVKTTAGEALAVRAERDALRLELDARDFAKLCDDATTEGKLPPANRAAFEAQALEHGREVERDGRKVRVPDANAIKFARAVLSLSQPIAAVTSTAPKPETKTHATMVLSDTENHIAKICGNSNVAKQRQAQATAKK